MDHRPCPARIDWERVTEGRNTGMRKRIFRFTPLLTTLVSGVFSLLSGLVWAQQSTPIMHYEISHALLASPDHFSVAVYEDGMALVHYPEAMQNAGDYSVQLTPSEVQKIRLLMEHPLVTGFDPAEIKKQKAAVDEQSDEVFYISDDSISDFDFRPGKKNQRLRLVNLEADARRYPGIGIFRKLAEFQAELHQLHLHPTARRLSE